MQPETILAKTGSTASIFNPILVDQIGAKSTELDIVAMLLLSRWNIKINSCAT
jgi:hypothetical protein